MILHVIVIKFGIHYRKAVTFFLDLHVPDINVKNPLCLSLCRCVTWTANQREVCQDTR